MTDNSSQTSGAGERRAIGGYHPQYRFAADLILRRLRDGKLEWIRLADTDPSAGKLDDLQIATPARLDAFQVKWSRHPSPFTFHDLTTGSAAQAPLAKALADGLTQLSLQHADRRVVVHFATNNYPSVSDRVPGATKPGLPAHFAAFLAECWRAWEAEGGKEDPSLPERWREAWDVLCAASGLDPGTFAKFARACRLDLSSPDPGWASPDAIGPAAAAREVEVWREDHDALTLKLYDLVVERAQRVEFTRDELLRELGWGPRVEFRNRHEFPSPETYRPVITTVDAFFAALKTNAGGYLILLGSPGSGKSTLLTETLRYRKGRVVRYYAYAPDSLEENLGRGEALNFLHDVTLAFDKAGFAVAGSFPRNDEALLSARLHRQLAKLGDEFTESGEQTILLIDGLDHIDREQSPTRSLLSVLPSPSVVPDGVYIVLGSQTDQLTALPANVRTQIANKERRLEMGRLSRLDVVRIVEAASLDPTPTGDEVNRIADLSGGHPLALAYVLNKLRRSRNVGVAKVLAEIEPFRERIDEQYEAHWLKLEGDYDVLRLLALLARLRGGMDWDWVEAWAEPKALFGSRRLEHYFRIEPSGRRFFFHNSFRAFLLSRTRHLPGVGSRAGDASLFRELAEHCAAASDESPQRWDELHYRAAAGDWEKVVALAAPEVLRTQFFAGRSPRLIMADLRRAFRGAGELGDARALTRSALIGLEIDQRDNALPDEVATAFLLGLGKARIAVDRIHDGNQLNVGAKAAMEAIAHIDAAGFHEDARRVFDLCEPIELLTRSSAPQAHEVQESDALLDAWVNAAPRFRPVERTTQLIEEVRRRENFRNDADEEEVTRLRRLDLRYRLAEALLDLDKKKEWEAFAATWDLAVEDQFLRWFWLHVHAWGDAVGSRDMQRANSLFTRVLVALPGRNLTSAAKLAMAEAALRIRGDMETAKAYVVDVEEPELAGLRPTASTAGFRVFDARFRLHRLLGAFGDDRALSTVIPEPKEQEHGGIALFERMVVLVARLWGRAWAGDHMSAGSFVSQVRGVLRLFSRSAAPAWRSWYLAHAGRAELYELLVRAANLHGSEVVDALRRAFEDEWSNAELSEYWPAEITRGVVTQLWLAGASDDWARAQLNEIAARALEGDNNEEKAKNALAHFHALLEVGDRAGAERVYDKFMASTLSVGYKDDQLVTWIEWAGRANRADEANAAERISRIAGHLSILDATTESRGYAIVPLLSAACEHSLECGSALLTWYLDNGLIHFPTGVSILLVAALRRSPQAAVLVEALHRHLILSTARHADVETMAEVARAAVSNTRTTAAESAPSAAVKRLLESVSVEAMASTRQHLGHAVYSVARELGVKGLGESPFRVPEPDHGSGENPAEHLEGSPITLVEAQQQAASLEGIAQLLRREKQHSYLRWEGVLAESVATADRNHVLAVGALFQEGGNPDRRWAVDILLADRLRELADSDGALSLAERAFVSAPVYGWDERYDGGSKIRALEAIARVDGARARKQGLAQLVADVARGVLGFQVVALGLDRILPLVAGEVSPLETWAEIASYLDQLLGGAVVSRAPPLPALATATTELVLCRIAAEYIDHPAHLLSAGAMRALVDALLEGRDSVFVALNAVMIESPHRNHALMAVIAAATKGNPSALTKIEGAVRLAAKSLDSCVRSMAEEILDSRAVASVSSGESLPSRPLPGVYGLTLRPRSKAERLREIAKGEVLPPTEDPVELVSAFRPELDIVAKAADVQREAVYHRVAQIMTTLPGSTPKAESDLQAQLQRMGFRSMSYRRPRSLLARRAMFQAIAELADAKRINASDLKTIEEITCDADPAMLRFRPVARPSFIGRIPEVAADKYLKEGWTDQARAESSALSASVQSVGGVVLAEATELRWLDWSVPTERREGARLPSKVSPRASKEDSLLSLTCDRWSQVRFEQYLRQVSSNEKLVVIHNGLRFDTPGRDWLALNPAIGLQLGWRFDPGGLFRWLGKDDSVMAESIWWQDGNIEMSPPSHEDEVGAGWLVIATELGWKQLNDVFGPLADYVRVERTAKDQPDFRAGGTSASAPA